MPCDCGNTKIHAAEFRLAMSIWVCDDRSSKINEARDDALGRAVIEVDRQLVSIYERHGSQAKFLVTDARAIIERWRTCA